MILDRYGQPIQRTPRRRRSVFQAAATGRLTAGWKADNLSADRELEQSLRLMRARCRERARNDDYAKRFVRLITRNVVGSAGIKLQVKSRDPNGRLDEQANDILESAFSQWARRGNCDVTTRLSWRDAQKLYVQTLATDGEVIVRMVNGWRRNDARIALQFIDADLLDENRNEDLRDGRQIRMGVEVDAWGAPTAYHLLTSHPSESYSRNGQRYIRIPAEEIIHDFLQERPGQTRGIPWMATPTWRMHMLAGYEDAEIVAARAGASKMGFFTRADDGTGFEGEEDEDGEIPMEAEPGTFSHLPAGVNFQQWDPSHPNSGFHDFHKSVLRGVSSGLDVSYNALANDLEGVNYSSIRAGVLEDREAYKDLQGHMIEAFCDRVYSKWLDGWLLNPDTPLPASRRFKFDAATWQGRRWDWVDPQKDQQANEQAIASRLKSRSQIIRESGRDPAEVWEEIAEEEAMLRELGILPAEMAPASTVEPDALDDQ